MPDPKAPATSLLYLDTVYPDPAAVFEFGPRTLKDALPNAIFVLDTNALLVPYGTDPSSLKAIRNTYTKLAKEKRLRVPAQVAREFAKNRPERLKEVYDQLAQRQSANITKAQYPLLVEIPEYETLKKVEAELESKLKEYRAAIAALLDRVRRWHWDDPVSGMYRQLFTVDVVVDAKLTPDEISKEFEFRYAHKVPPGYKDGSKDLGAAGDLIIWKTILAIGQTEKKDLIFVSGEEKADWWYRASQKVLYPRFELLDEYRRASDGQTFHILSLADLLKEFGVKQEVVDAVREEEASLMPVTRPSAPWAPEAIAAVEKWLDRQGTVVRDRQSGYDILERYVDGSKLHIEVRLVHNERVAAPKMYRAVSGALARKALPYRLVLVGRSMEAVSRVRAVLTQALADRPIETDEIEVRLGLLREGAFLPMANLWPPG